MRMFDAIGRWLERSSKNERPMPPTVSSEELSQAFSICKKASGSLSTDYMWRTERWLKVIDFFGQDKAEVMEKMLEEMTTAFLLIEHDPRGVTVGEEARSVSKIFQEKFPLAPQELVSYLENRFMIWNR